MFITRKAESLAWIIIWVFILSFVLLWIGTLIWNSKTLVRDFDKKMNLELLSSSSYLIINNLNLSTLVDGDNFYLYKNNTDSISNTNDSKYKYIDKYWNYISDTSTFIWDIYLRESKVIDKVIETTIYMS